MNGAGMIDAMKKSYERNRALLRQGKAFERLKDHYQQTNRMDAQAAPDFEELARWHRQRARARRRTRMYVALIYAALATGVILLYNMV